MANSFDILSKQLGELWRRFGINQKISIIISLIATVAAISGVMYWSVRPSYRLLYSGMSLQDAAAARERIEDERIPVMLKDSGRSLYVPAGDVYRCRLLLASEGLPKDSSTGFELFEQPKFGLTDFAQKVNYQRALQGELERTIAAMEGISSARVLLVLPSEKLFAADKEKKASASVMLNVTANSQLGPTQVRSIKQLLSGAVTGLSPSGITITDQYGRALAKMSDTDAGEVQAASEQMEAKHKFEFMLAGKAQEMLDMAFGEGRSIVRVSALLDFSVIEKQSETYDAEGRVVASETISSETSSEPSPGMMGGGQVTASVSVADPGRLTMEQATSKMKREDITTQYKIPSGREHIVETGARIKNLSVSVCVAKNENPRTPEELKAIEEMVRNAVGFIETGERTDSIKVVEMEFYKPAATTTAGWWQAMPVSIIDIAKGVVAIVVLLVIFYSSRRIIGGLSVERSDIGVPVGSLSLGAGPATGGMPEISPTLDDVMRIAEQNPKAIAAWITNISKA